MRYYFDIPKYYTQMYGETYECNHPIYNKCTLIKIGDYGLAIIQQRFDSATKTTWWGEIDPWLADILYIHPKFKEFFDKRAGKSANGLYHTVTIRQIMWALKMKPLKKEQWETVFDRNDI